MFHVEDSTIFEGCLSRLTSENCNQMVDCMLNNDSNLSCSNSDLADMMQLAEVGPILASNEARSCDQEEEKTSLHVTSAIEILQVKAKNKRKKRARSSKSSEEVERQRMIHIAVERNRRKQMNEHLQILRTLMPTYYVNRGDQASIVGGAIQFVRELQHLLHCLESAKMHHHQAPLILPTTLDDQVQVVEHESGADQMAESSSCLADVEVRLAGSFGLIKILSRRRPGQLIKIIAAVEHLQLHILQTNVTTIQQDVVCSFSVKRSGEAMLTAEDIANSIQQMLTSVHAISSMS